MKIEVQFFFLNGLWTFLKMGTSPSCYIYSPYGSYSLFQFEGSDIISVLKNSIEYSFVFFKCLIRKLNERKNYEFLNLRGLSIERFLVIWLSQCIKFLINEFLI